jgi:transposase
MKPYSNDLRRRIVDAYESGDYTLDEVAELFGVSLASVKNFVRRKRQTGSADALPHAGGQKPSLNQKHTSFVRDVINESNDLTLKELCLRLKRKHKKDVSLPTMSRLLTGLGLPRKKSRSTLAKETPQESSTGAMSIGKK